MTATDYRPTRSCPHRLCRPTHVVGAVAGLCAFAQLAFHSIVGLAFMLAMAVLGYGVFRAVHNKTMWQVINSDLAEEAAGVELIARPGWTNIAIGCDLLFTLSGGAVNIMLFRGDTAGTVPTPDAAGYAGIGIGVGLMLLAEVSHRQATRPAKPKRLLAPARGAA